MPVFEEMERTNHSPALHGESEYAFLNRSARPAAAIVREQIEEWIGAFPHEERETLTNRLRTEFTSAFHELVLYSLLKAHPAEVSVHPLNVSGNEKLPDFFVRFPPNTHAIFEAVLARDATPEEAAREARRSQLYDKINEIESDFFFVIRRVENPTGLQPPSRKVVAFLRRELGQLDVETSRRALEADTSWRLPASLFRDGELEIEFEFIPKAPELRGKGRSIGVYPGEARWGGSAVSLKAAIERKATRYGELSHPYIVAINSLSSWSYGHDDVMEALFGPPAVLQTQGLPGFREIRIPNGAFLAPNGSPQNTRVSGIVVGFLVPWNLGVARLTLYQNPFAARSAEGIPWRLDRVIPQEEESHRMEGEGVWEVLGLPPGWPGELFD